MRLDMLPFAYTLSIIRIHTSKLLLSNRMHSNQLIDESITYAISLYVQGSLDVFVLLAPLVYGATGPYSTTI